MVSTVAKKLKRVAILFDNKSAKIGHRVSVDWLRFDAFAPLMLSIVLYAGGQFLAQHYPHLGTNGLHLLVWGFFISNVVVLHTTLAINSVSHCIVTHRFETKDQGRNNWLLALVTFGEGWHNNHHLNPRSTRQGSVWWEFDLTYVLLTLLSKFRVVSELIPFHSNKTQEC